MQNKPNFQNTQMNVTSAQISSYQLPVTNYQYAKQTQFKPNFIRRSLGEGGNNELLTMNHELYTIGHYGKIFTN